MQNQDIDVLVTGGSGFVGRWLLADLTRRGRRVAALVRGASARADELRGFVGRIGGDPDHLAVFEGDVEKPDLGLAGGDLEGVRDVFHGAARYAFGIDAAEARRSNLDGTLHVARWALGRPTLRRFVEIGGYRMTRQPSHLAGVPSPFSASLRARLVASHGAYMASKHEAHAALARLAADEGLPMTVVHPCGVIGDSRTGETTQVIGLGETVEKLWRGRLPALAGRSDTWLPLITVDHLAALTATVCDDEATLGQALVALDPTTPLLPDLMARIAAHLGVAPPRLTLPVGLVAALPRAVTGIEPENLTFLVADRYDTRSADAHARAAGIVSPPLDASIAKWCDHLVSTRFAPGKPADRGGFSGATTRIYSVGRADARLVYLHGIPWNGDSWKPVAERVGRAHKRVDFPGLGRSAGARNASVAKAVLPTSGRVTIVGHSLGAAAAVELARQHPDRVAAIVLVAPAFLQAPPPSAFRLWPLVGRRLARATAGTLAARFVPGTDPEHPALVSAAYDLRRKGVASSTARVLAQASRADARAAVRAAFASLPLPILIVHGSRDALVVPTGDAEVITIEGAGHDPHLSHPDEVSAAVRRFVAHRDAGAAHQASA